MELKIDNVEYVPHPVAMIRMWEPGDVVGHYIIHFTITNLNETRLSMEAPCHYGEPPMDTDDALRYVRRRFSSL